MCGSGANQRFRWNLYTEFEVLLLWLPFFWDSSLNFQGLWFSNTVIWFFRPDRLWFSVGVLAALNSYLLQPAFNLNTIKTAIWHVLIPFYTLLTLLHNLPAFVHSLVPLDSLPFVFCAKFIADICKRISLVGTYFVITGIGTKFFSFESQNLYQDSNFPVLTHL